MSEVTLAPYILTDANGSNPRIMIPVKTPAALVMVESSARGRLRVRGSNRDGATIAITVARRYLRVHQKRIDGLYERLASNHRAEACTLGAANRER
jgi:hypothetical protein